MFAQLSHYSNERVFSLGDTEFKGSRFKKFFLASKSLDDFDLKDNIACYDSPYYFLNCHLVSELRSIGKI